jgi:hypothetical protein
MVIMMTLRQHAIRGLALTTPILALAIAAFLFTLPVSHAQQDRQLTQTGSAGTASSKRIALVIGNGTYTSAPPLKNPPNDARDMAATLKVLGFSVSSAIDADQRTMKRLIREFGQQLKGGGQGLFYYAGHGVQMRGRNYLIPANADITSEADVEDQAVDLNLVLGLMDEAQNGLNIVIVDACRNNPFTRSFRSAGSGLAQVDAPTGTLIAYATSPGRVASDGTGRNGLYTSELLTQMRVSGIGVEEMFKRVRASVQRQTTGQQVPWESSSLVGNFYFAPTSVDQAVALEKNVKAIDPMAFELSYWDSIKNSTNAEDFRSYLEKYPNGQFAALARNRLSVAAEKDKPTAKEPTRNTRNFKGKWGYAGAGTLVIASDKIQFVFDDSTRDAGTTTVGTKEDSSCNGFTDARVEGNVIRDITYSDAAGKLIPKIKRQFEAESAAEANEALGAVRRVCANSGESSAKGTDGYDPLAGTRWTGDSSGGDKHYDFQFPGNFEVIWSLKWGRLNDPTFRGTYTLNGNVLRMVFDATKVTGGNQEVAAELSGDSFTGSWNFGRAEIKPNNGMYKFTVRKVK